MHLDIRAVVHFTFFLFDCQNQVSSIQVNNAGVIGQGARISTDNFTINWQSDYELLASLPVLLLYVPCVMCVYNQRDCMVYLWRKKKTAENREGARKIDMT